MNKTEYKGKLYFAPMEGITTRVYRSVFRKHFTGIDRFYTPFLAATQTHHFKKRELKEIEPFEGELVPQILTANSDDFVWAAKMIRQMGYPEVDLNLGCPYPTVFTKGKGSGMLKDMERLDRFFSEVFSVDGLPEISVKTRIGISNPDEAEKICEVLKKYPFSQVIIHPRVREEFYDGEPHKDAFGRMADNIGLPVCYNGNISSLDDVRAITGAFPGLAAIMIGRGLLMDPSLGRETRGGHPATGKEIRHFMDELWDAYAEVLYGERDVLFKMKELWHYLGQNYPEKERPLLDIKKSKTKEEYENAVFRVIGF